MPLPIAITMGDAAGIGPEIIARAYLEQPQQMRGCFVAGDVGAMRRAAALFCGPDGPALPVARISAAAEVNQVPVRCLPVLQVGASQSLPQWGRLSRAAGECAGACVFWAADSALRGEVAAIVTAPLNKAALAGTGSAYADYAGHTEMLQARAAQFLGCSAAQLPVRMMLCNDELRTVLVSVHLSLRDAIAAVTMENVLQTVMLTHISLAKWLGRVPRIAVAGLNPHAGEGGRFGREEIEIISPALELARAQGCDVSGPWPPDTIFMRARQRPGVPAQFDAVVAMYHDQGLIPVKYLGLEHGVNVTLGLPLVRTSPDHGTAFDIAGTAVASASSLLKALQTARDLLIS
jgi:4-hydroxythreonine-4-phosphate dehydrogenase